MLPAGLGAVRAGYLRAVPRLLVESADGHVELCEAVHPASFEDPQESVRTLERLRDAVEETMMRERLQRHRVARFR